MFVYILLALLVVGSIALIIYYNVLLKKGYERGYKAGVMISFWWIETNTVCTDAVQTYMEVIRKNPQDGIYILELDDDGNLVFPKNAELIDFQNR